MSDRRKEGGSGEGERERERTEKGRQNWAVSLVCLPVSADVSGEIRVERGVGSAAISSSRRERDRPAAAARRQFAVRRYHPSSLPSSFPSSRIKFGVSLPLLLATCVMSKSVRNASSRFFLPFLLFGPPLPSLPFPCRRLARLYVVLLAQKTHRTLGSCRGR